MHSNIGYILHRFYDSRFAAVTWLAPLKPTINPAPDQAEQIYAKAARSFQPNGEPEPEPVMQRVCNMADGLGDKCIQILDKLENAAGHTANDIPISKSRRSAEAKQPMNRPQSAR